MKKKLNSHKIAISLPKEDFVKIEQLRRKLKLDRSSIIDKAIKFWFNKLEEQELIKKYQEGYKRKPESIKEIMAMEYASAEALNEPHIIWS